MSLTCFPSGDAKLKMFRSFCSENHDLKCSIGWAPGPLPWETEALRSGGLEEMGGASFKVKLGGDGKQVFQPSNSKAKAVWEDFCDSVSEQHQMSNMRRFWMLL